MTLLTQLELWPDIEWPIEPGVEDGEEPPYESDDEDEDGW